MVDVAVSRRMGLFVVGRLAARHGIRVQLRPAASGGLTALVLLPNEVITHENPAEWPGSGGFDTARPGAGLPETGFAAPGHDDRAIAEQEVSAPRTPKVAPARADAASYHLARGACPGRRACGLERRGQRRARFRRSSRVRSRQPGRGEPSAAGARASSDGLVAGYCRPSGAGSHWRPGRSSAHAGGGQEPAGTPLGVPAAHSWETGSANSGVIVPSAESLADENRLPIFEAVESDWFRRPGTARSRQCGQPTHLGFVGGRGLACRRNSSHAVLRRPDACRAAQASAAGESCPWNGPKHAASGASQVGRCDTRAVCRLPTRRQGRPCRCEQRGRPRRRGRDFLMSGGMRPPEWSRIGRERNCAGRPPGPCVVNSAGAPIGRPERKERS